MQTGARVRKAIGYTRVSTSEQGNSGLGLAAQRCRIEEYARVYGYEILDDDWVREIASGKTSVLTKRPVLVETLRKARRTKAVIIVAKVDRLSRSTHLLIQLLDNVRVQFRAADVGDEADNTLLRLRAVLAEGEREQISKRTSDALQAAKKQGVVLGNPINLKEVALRGAAANARQADQFASTIMPYIERIRASGWTTYRDISSRLNALGVKTARDGEWHGMSVKRIIDRAKSNQPDLTACSIPTSVRRRRKKQVSLSKQHIASPANPRRNLEF